MRRRLLLITTLLLAVITAVTWILASRLRAGQRELNALWVRLDATNDAMRLTANQLGRVEAVLEPQAARAGGPVAERVFEPDLALAVQEIRAQTARLGALVTDRDAQDILREMRLLLGQLSAGARPTGQAERTDAGLSARAAAATVARMRSSFERLWMRTSDLASREINEFASGQQRETERLLLVLVLAAVAGSLITAYHIFRVADLLRDFIGATRRLAAGQWSYRLAPPPAPELRELADSFNAMADALAAAEEKRMEAAQEMLVTLQHELGNAMGSISGLVQLLRRHETELTPSVVSALTKIQDTVDRVARTVSRLRDVSSLHVAEYPGGLKMFDVEAPDRATAPSAVAGAEHRTP